MSNLKNFLKKYDLEVIYSISLGLLLLISPVLGIFFLIFPTIYYLFYSNYKTIFVLWFSFFLSWYLFFTACMIGYSDPIWIGGEHTVKIWYYFSIKYSTFSSSYKWYTCLFEGFCIQTLFYLDFLSSILGFPLYIPSILKALLVLLKYMFGGKGGSSAKCSPKEETKSSAFKSNYTPENKRGKVDDLETCEILRNALRTRRGLFGFLNVEKSVRGNRYTVYGEARIPFTGILLTNCGSRNATKDEIKESKK